MALYRAVVSVKAVELSPHTMRHVENILRDVKYHQSITPLDDEHNIFTFSITGPFTDRQGYRERASHLVVTLSLDPNVVELEETYYHK